MLPQAAENSNNFQQFLVLCQSDAIMGLGARAVGEAWAGKSASVAGL